METHLMQKFILIIFSCIVYNQELFSQKYKSPSRIILEVKMKKITTRVIIVGVSEYKNLPESQQLLYADDDAEALYDFLKSKKEIDSININIFLNSKANSESIRTNLYRVLLNESNPGDIVIFYFAGHGDVDANIDDGFLLMHNVSNDGDYFISDALQISEVQKLVTKAGEKGVKVLLITDACRAGKFVGNNKGALYTTSALIREWQHALKLVSCQADQGSIEGEAWGKGHGVFTFYLINGLKGLADENNDGVVTFGEISDYVRSNVKKDTEYKQVPKSTGDETYSLFLVDSLLYAEAKKSIDEHKKNVEDAIRGRGVNLRGIGISPYIQSLIDSMREQILFDNLLGALHFIEENDIKIEISNQKTFSAHRGYNINEVLYSIDNRQLITASNDKLVKIWDAKSFKNIHILKKHKEAVLCIDNNPVLKNQVVSAGADNTIYIWNTDVGKPIRKIKNAHNTQVLDIQYSRDGKYIISCGDDNKIKIWSSNNGKLIKTLDGHFSDVTTLCLSPDGKQLVSGDKKGGILIWDFASYSLIRKLEHHTKKINAIKYQIDDNSFISCSEGGKVIIWNAKTFKPIKIRKLKSLNKIAYDIYNKHVFITDKRNTINLLDYESEEIDNKILKIKKITSLKIYPKINKLVVGSSNGNVLVANLKLPELIPSAKYLYETIIKHNISKHVHEKLKGELFSALVTSSSKTIDLFILGLDIVPAIDDVRESIKKLNAAIQLYNHDNLLTVKVNFKKLFLEAQEVILTNDYKNYESAIKKMKYIIEEEPDAAYPYNILSVLYQKLKNVSKAKENASIAIEKTPRWTEPRNNLGKIYLAEGKYDKAISEYEEIIKLQPKSSKGYNNIGNIYHSLGAYKKAEDFYEKSISVDPLNPYTYLKYSELQLSRGRYKDAEKLLSKSNEIDPTYLKSLLYNAKLYNYLYQNDFKNKEYIELAYYYLKEANIQFPNDPDTYTNLSIFYINHLENKNNDGYKYLCEIFNIKECDRNILKRTVTNEIKRLCNKALEFDPFSTEALEGIAFAAITQNNNEYAENLYLKAIDDNPNSPRPYCKYAIFCKKKGDFEKATVNYKAAIEKDKRYLLAYIDLWDLYIQLNRKDEINQLYALAVKNFPDSPVFHYKKSLLNKKVSKKDIKKALEIDDNYFFATLLLYNQDYVDYKDSYREIEDQQYVTRLSRIKRLDNNYMIIKDREWFNWLGIMHISGNITIPIEYNTIVKVNNTLVCALKNNKNELFWYNFEGDLFKYREYTRVYFNNNGDERNKNNRYINVEKNGKSGCIDMLGKIIVPIEYQETIDFSNGNGLIGVVKNDKVGCYNLNGKLVIPIKYETIKQGFNVRMEPCCFCTLNGKTYLLDYNGRTIGMGN